MDIDTKIVNSNSDIDYQESKGLGKEKTKVFKDPIYGYIYIPLKYISIIDSPAFQRLRRISQTSYSPLYSSALHNRFVHSMGVFHLAQTAIAALYKNAEGYFKPIENNKILYTEVFKLAALLHDVGHAPFSHTGENFFLGESHKNAALHEELIKLVGSEDFKLDVLNAPSSKNSANPHEIMSAIVGIQQFDSFLNKQEAREFFARCITGYKYNNSKQWTKPLTDKEKLLNCFVNLLNSKVIDVDKLDYLIRDAFVLGYDSVKIDYVRLLGALTIISEDDEYILAYNKSAISVIENVVYARDAEKKWIQSHPVVLYENFIIQECMNEIVKEKGYGFFSSDSLSPKGIDCDNTHFSLLCDDDIITYIKSKNKAEVEKRDVPHQYFDRAARMHALWKSEAEYRAMIKEKLTADEFTLFQKTMAIIVNASESKSDKRVEILDQNYLSGKRKELNEYKHLLAQDPEHSTSYNAKIKKLELIIQFVECLFKYAAEKGMEDCFVIIPSDCFNSGFDNMDFVNMRIKFNDDCIKEFNKIVSTLAFEKNNGKVYYLYYFRNGDEKCTDLCSKITACFKENN